MAIELLFCCICAVLCDSSQYYMYVMNKSVIKRKTMVGLSIRQNSSGNKVCPAHQSV